MRLARQCRPPTVVPPPAPEYTRPDYLRMFGATAPDGAPWIQVQVDCDEGPDAQPGRSVWTPLADWEGDAGAAKRRLSAGHIHLPPDEAMELVLQQAAKMSRPREQDEARCISI